MTLKLLKNSRKEERSKRKSKNGLELNSEIFWDSAFDFTCWCIVFTYFAIVYALFVPSFFSFLLSLTLSIYLSIEYNYDDAHAISLLYYYVIENDWQCFPVQSTENYCLSNGWKSNWSKMFNVFMSILYSFSLLHVLCQSVAV